MTTLYEQHGKVYAWLDLESGRIYGLNGQNLAFIDDDSVYDWRGKHVGWWQEDHIRDRQGAVALFMRNAGSIGVVKPVCSVAPVRPVKAVAPVRPVKSVRPVRPVRKLAWSARMPF
jgi:hypothetical protein